MLFIDLLGDGALFLMHVAAVLSSRRGRHSLLFRNQEKSFLLMLTAEANKE